MQSSHSQLDYNFKAPNTVPAGRLKPLSVPSLEMPGATEKTISTQRFKLKLSSQGEQGQTGMLLVKHAYVWGNTSITSFDRKPNKITLFMFFGETAIGTLTLRLDSPTGLDADQLYRREMDLLRHRGHKICEFTQMALDRNIRSKRVMASLFHLAYLYATKVHGCTDIMLESTARHVSFYQEKFGFSLFSKEKECPRAKSTAMLLRLPAEYVENMLNEVEALAAGNTTNQSKQIYAYFLNKNAEADLLHKLLTDSQNE